MANPDSLKPSYEVSVKVPLIKVRSKSMMIAALLFLAVALRLGIMPWSFHPWEGHTWINIGADIYEGRNPYEVGKDLSLQVSSRPPGGDGYALFYEYVAYPPVWPLIMYPFYRFVAPEQVDFVFGGAVPAPLSPMANFWLKAPIVAFDFAIAFALFRICPYLKIDRPWAVVWLWLFNPLVFIISAIWGHFESVVIFFALASFWAYFSGRHTLSALSIGAAIGTKLYPVIFVPILLYGVYQRDGLMAALRYSLIVAAVVAGISSLYAVQDISAFMNIFTFHGERLGGGMTYYNFAILAWVLWGKSPLYWGLNFTNMYFPIMLWAFGLVHLWALRLDLRNPRVMTTASTVVLLVFFATTKLVNEAYAMWAIPALLLISMYDRRAKLPFYLITALPLFYLAINTPWPNFFRLFILDTWVLNSPIGFMFLDPVKKFSILFMLGTGFSLLSITTAVLLVWKTPRRNQQDADEKPDEVRPAEHIVIPAS